MRALAALAAILPLLPVALAIFGGAGSSISSPAADIASGAGVGTLIMYAGGTSGSPTDVVNIYDTDIHDFNQDQLSRPRSSAAVAGVGLWFLVAGGFEQSGTSSPSNQVDVYDISQQQFVSTDNLSLRRGALAGAASGTSIVFGGGITDNGVYSAVVDVWDTATQQFVAPLSLSVARARLVAVAAGGLIVFAGGVNGGGPQSTVDLFNVATRAFLTATDMSIGRARLAACAAGSLVFIGGGETSGGQPTDLLEVYDTSARAWVPTSSRLSVARYDLAAGSDSLEVLFAGGTDQSGAPRDTIDVFDAVSAAEVPAGIQLASARTRLAGGYASNAVVFAGGFDGSYLNDEDEFFSGVQPTLPSSCALPALPDNTAICTAGVWVSPGPLGIGSMPVGRTPVAVDGDLTMKTGTLRIAVSNNKNYSLPRVSATGSLNITAKARLQLVLAKNMALGTRVIVPVLAATAGVFGNYSSIRLITPTSSSCKFYTYSIDNVGPNALTISIFRSSSNACKWTLFGFTGDEFAGIVLGCIVGAALLLGFVLSCIANWGTSKVDESQQRLADERA